MRSVAEGAGAAALGQHARALAQSGAPRRRFDARRNHKRQRAFVVDRNLRVPHAERREDLFSLLVDGITIVSFDARFELDVDAATLRGSRRTCTSERISWPECPASPACLASVSMFTPMSSLDQQPNSFTTVGSFPP